MRKLVLSAALALGFPTLALAQVPGPDSTTMTCEKTRNLVVSQGAAVIFSGGPNVYDRYVNSLNYCERGMVLTPSWVPTQDSAQCYVGYRCQMPGMNRF